MIFLFNHYRVLNKLCSYNFDGIDDDTDRTIHFQYFKRYVPFMSESSLRKHCRILAHQGLLWMTMDDDAHMHVTEQGWNALYQYKISAYRTFFSVLWAIGFAIFGAAITGGLTLPF